MIFLTNGSVKFSTGYGKFYRSRVVVDGKGRILRRQCKTATQALEYGNRVRIRAQQMAKAGITPGIGVQA